MASVKFPCIGHRPLSDSGDFECNGDISTVGELLVRYRFLGTTTRNNSTRIIVVRKAEPGTIEKNNHQMLWGKPARTGDRLKVSQSPTTCVANSNAKSKACLRVSSMVTSSIVAPRRQMAKSGVYTTVRHLFALQSIRSRTLLRPDSSEPIRQRGVHGQVLAITHEPTAPTCWIYSCV